MTKPVRQSPLRPGEAARKHAAQFPLIHIFRFWRLALRSMAERRKPCQRAAIVDAESQTSRRELGNVPKYGNKVSSNPEDRSDVEKMYELTVPFPGLIRK
jgi:hypothetical protein